MGCGIYTTEEGGQLIFPWKFYSSDYLFVYAADENNVVCLIHPTPQSEDTLESEILDQDVVDTMVDYMLEEMVLK